MRFLQLKQSRLLIFFPSSWLLKLILISETQNLYCQYELQGCSNSAPQFLKGLDHRHNTASSICYLNEPLLLFHLALLNTGHECFRSSETLSLCVFASIYFLVLHKPLESLLLSLITLLQFFVGFFVYSVGFFPLYHQLFILR